MKTLTRGILYPDRQGASLRTRLVSTRAVEVEFFMISSQSKNVEHVIAVYKINYYYYYYYYIANFVLAVSSQVEKTHTLQHVKPFANCHLILHLVTYKDSNNEENSIFMGIQS